MVLFCLVSLLWELAGLFGAFEKLDSWDNEILLLTEYIDLVIPSLDFLLADDDRPGDLVSCGVADLLCRLSRWSHLGRRGFLPGRVAQELLGKREELVAHRRQAQLNR